MSFSLRGDVYEYVVASDLDRDGMSIEVFLHADESTVLLEVFYSDQTQDMTISLFKPDLPVEVIEWAIAVAKERLPSNRKRDPSV